MIPPPQGTVSWNINTACNYRCSYCTQRFKEDRARWSQDTPRFLEAFARLPGEWEIKISGGEPFVHPTLNDIVAGLAQQGRWISIVTNFSASQHKLEQFLQAASQRVRVFSCSLHLEYADIDDFIAKARWLNQRLARPLNVTCVATRSNLPRLPAIAQRFRSAQVTFKIQPEKQDRDVVAYTPEEHQMLVELGGHNRLGEVAFDFQGRPCWAGGRYFVMDDRGECFRCYPARRYKYERMGNFLEPNFRLAERASECLYSYCNCSVPIERGMMKRDSERSLPDAL